jgi:hypothetical protein
MSDMKLERRMADLELEVQSLRKKVEELSGKTPWWDRIAGTFEQDPIYERAMKLGKKYRRAQRSDDPRPLNE